MAIIVICLLLLIVTNTVISAQQRELRRLLEEKWKIELRYIMDQHDPSIMMDREKYEEFTEKMRAGELIDKDSEKYETWMRLDREYRKRYSGTIYHLLGFIPAKSYRVHTIFTSVFVHGGVLHFLGNMWFLWLLGYNIEDVWGRRNFLLFFLGAGVVATFLHGLVNWGSNVPAIGASGAIAGVMGAFMIRNHRTKIKCFYMFFPHPAMMGTFLLPAWAVLGLYFVMDLLHGLMSFGNATGTAYWAHVGGFLAGIGTAAAFKMKGIEEKYITPKLEEKIEAVKITPLMELAFKERDKGNFEKAVKVLEELVSQQAENVDAYREMGNIHVTINNHEQAGDAFARVIQIFLKRGEDEAALSTYYEMKMRGMPLPLSPHDLYALAGALYRKERIDESLQMYQQLIKEAPDSEIAPKAVLRCGKLLEESGKIDLAISAYKFLLSRYPEIEWKDLVLSEIRSLERKKTKHEE